MFLGKKETPTMIDKLLEVSMFVSHSSSSSKVLCVFAVCGNFFSSRPSSNTWHGCGRHCTLLHICVCVCVCTIHVGERSTIFLQHNFHFLWHTRIETEGKKYI